MYCKNCGATLEDGAVFCSSCGQKCPVENDVQQANVPNAQTNYPTNDAMSSNYPNNDAMSSNYPDNIRSSNYPNNSVTSSNYPDSDAVSSNYEQSAPVLLQEQPADEAPALFNTEDGTPLYPGLETPASGKPKKKKKFLKVFIPVVAVIVLLAATALVFGKTIFFAVAPEAYVAKLIQNTSDELTVELNQIEENVFGFDITMNNEMTAGISMDYKDAYDEFKYNLSIANDPENEKLLAEGDYENDYGKGSGYGYLDNENAGLMLPGSDKNYLSIPTKDFGKKLKSSDGFINATLSDEADKTVYDILSGLDLSYSNIKQAISADEEVTKKINKHVADNLIDLLKKSEIGKREGIDYEFENKTVKAHEITLTVDPADIRDFTVKIYEAIGDDDEINKFVDYDKLMEAIEKLEEESEDSGYTSEVSSDYEIKLVEYKSKIVSVAITYSMDTEYKDPDPEYGDYSSTTASEITLTISTTNKDKLLNGITIKNSVNHTEDYKDEEIDTYTLESETEISLTSDWATKRKKNDDDITGINISVANERSTNSDYKNTSDVTLDFVLDFEKEKWELDVDTKYSYKYSDGESDSSSDNLSYDGKCSKDGGFSFTVNEKWEDEKWEYGNDMTYDEWLDDEYDRYRDDYLEYVYDDIFWYDYDSYDDWYYSDSRSVWDVPDSDFEDWLYDEYYYYGYNDLEDAYESNTSYEEAIPVDAYAKFEFTLKNEVDVKSKGGDNDNILNWSEDDFYDFGVKCEDEFSH